MKTHTKIALVCSVALLFWHPVAAKESNPCAKHQNKRFVTGPEPGARKLYKAACLADAGPWADGFTEEDFSYLGNLRDNTGHTYEIAFLSTIWGESGRATNRLLVFGRDNEYLGGFNYVDILPTLKPPYTLKFPSPPKWGNTVSFKNGIPSSIWVDGENYSFYKAHKSYKRMR